MRIVVVGKRNHLYWDFHVAQAFKLLGHDVLHFQINKRPFLIDCFRSIVKSFGKKELSDNLYALKMKEQIKNFKPHFIFFTSAFFIPIEYYRQFHELNVPILAWDGDGGPSYDSSKKYVSYIDILFESELLYVKENRLNFKTIKYLPFAANVNMFFPKKKRREKRIFFAGAYTPKRQKIIQAIEYPMKLRGWGWNGLPKKNNWDIKNKKLNIQDMIYEYNSSYIALNIHQEINHIEALNMRTFEAPACGAVLLSDYRKELELHFDIDKEILVYSNIEELKEKVKLLENEKFLDKVSERGYKIIKSKHTYLHRMKTVLKELQ